MKILVADDDPVAREVLEALLEQADHQVVFRSEGTDVCKLYQEADAPRLIILNRMMPGIDGIEVCRKIREISRPNLPYILFVTGKDRKSDIVAGLEAGANDYVTKPFDLDELSARVGVGVRMVNLQERLLEMERTHVLAETAGAAAHEINQPLAILMGRIDLMLQQASDPAQQSDLEALQEAVERISETVRKMGSARQYVTKPYIGSVRIVDFDGATQEPPEQEG